MDLPYRKLGANGIMLVTYTRGKRITLYHLTKTSSKNTSHYPTVIKDIRFNALMNLDKIRNIDE